MVFSTLNSMVPLERCRQDGAYQYLAVREQRKSYEFVLLHVSVKQTEGHRTEKRMTKVVAKVPKAALGFHGLGINGAREGASLQKPTVGLDRGS